MSSQFGAGAGPVLEKADVLTEEPPRRSPLLGIASFVLALLTFLALPIAMLLVDQPDFLSQASAISGRVVAAQLVGLIVSGGLAIVAVLSRRGRVWGTAALALLIALLLVGMLLPLVASGMTVA